MKYCSLGSACHPSKVFKRNGFKQESYPFDWANTTTEVIRDCIEDDFNRFLDKDLYSPAQNFWEGDRVCNHDYYKPLLVQEDHLGRNILFRHRDPLHNEGDYEYYKRCVERFRNLLASEERKVFLKMHFNKGEDITDTILESFSLCKFLNNYTSNFTLIVVHQQVADHRDYQLINGKDLKFINLKTISADDGGTYDNPDDEPYLDQIIKRVINDIR